MDHSVNEDLYDEAVLTAILIHRYGGALARKIIELLNGYDTRLLDAIARKLERVKDRGFDPGPTTIKRLQSIRSTVREAVAEAYRDVAKELGDELVSLARSQAEAGSAKLDATVGLTVGIRPSPSILQALVKNNPFQGRLLKDWIKDLEQSKVKQLMDAISIGLIEGQTNEQIIRRIRGTRANNYRDGILEVSRRNAVGLVRTAVNSVANAALNAVFVANADIIKGVRWVSTLDSRTTVICRSRDGNIYPVDSGPRPPAHWNCRSVMVAVTRSWSELVKDGALTRGRGADDIETLFQNMLKAQGFTPEQRAGIIRNARASMNGQVPADMTYSQWFAKQSASIQDDILGKAKGRIYRKGGLTLEQFSDNGRPLTLEQLKVKYGL